MQTLEAIFSRRSVRAFLPEPVNDQQLETLVQAAAAAPSGGNAQRRIFLAIRQPQRVAALRALSPGVIDLPPAIILICLDRRGLSADEAITPWLSYDIGAALQNMLLAAHDMGLGACPVASFHPQGVATLLHLPQDILPCLMVVVGKPKVFPSAPPKRKLAEIFFMEKFDARSANE